MSARPERGATRRRASAARRYYGRPVIKPPVWTPEIPLYFFAGGLAGASAGARRCWRSCAGTRALARRAWALALAGGVVSPALLISDLGRPERFLQHAAHVQGRPRR